MFWTKIKYLLCFDLASAIEMCLNFNIPDEFSNVRNHMEVFKY